MLTNPPAFHREKLVFALTQPDEKLFADIFPSMSSFSGGTDSGIFWKIRTDPTFSYLKVSPNFNFNPESHVCKEFANSQLPKSRF